MLTFVFDAQTYAKYLTKVVKAFHHEGIPIWRLSLQNEPQFEPKYPGTLVNSDAAADIGDLVRAEFDKAGLNRTELIALDHNWDLAQYPIDVFNRSTSFKGVGWHCYVSPSGKCRQA